MKKFFCALIIILTVCNVVFATETKLRVGYVPETGFLEEDNPGHLRGYGYEYMEFLSRYGNWKFEYVPSTSWEECGEKLQNGMIDLLPAMPGDYRSLKNVTRTDHVIGRYPMQLVTKDGKVKPEMKIATNPSNAPVPALPKVAEQEGFKYKLVNYKNFYEMEEALKRDDVDGYITPMLEPSKTKNVAAIFDRQSYRLLVKSDNKDLLAEMNSAMDKMLMDQPNIRNRLNDKYLRPGGSPLILDSDEKKYLADKKKLRTAILMQDKPYAYYEGRELHGVIPAVIRQISKDLGIEIEIVMTKNPQESANLIQRGAVDFIADAVCDFSWAATLNMAPTQSFLHLDYVSVTRRGEEVKNNSLVACVPSLLYTKNFIFPRYPEERRVNFSTLEECFQAVGDGAADILFAPRTEVNFLIDKTSAYNLEVAAESNFADEISLGVSLDADRKLWQILNKEVNHMDVAKIRSAVNEDMSQSANRFSLQWQLYHNPLRFFAVMLLLAAAISAAIYYRMRLRRKHLKLIQQMAFTDARYQLPNLSRLESEMPEFFSQVEDTEENLYVAAFKITEINKKLQQEKNLMSAQMKKIAAELNQSEEVLFTSTGEDARSLVSIFRCKDFAAVARVAREVSRKCGFLETKDARIWSEIKVGVAKADKENFQQSVEHAQFACQKSSKDVKIFDATLAEEINLEKRLESLMQSALENGEFQAWYQTEYEIKTHKPVGEEAFVRWQSSELGFLLPEKFMSLFERNGFITAVDYFMVEEACKLQKSRQEEGKELLPIAINQSGLHLTEEDYLEKMRKILQKYKLPKNVLKLEFSEKIFVNLPQGEHEKRLTNIFRSLQKMGFKISSDDFGDGFSSYKLLNFLPIDELKIDGTLLYSAVNSERMRDILENIIQLGNKLGLKVICEGVETKAQEKLLLDLNCQFGQGFINSALVTEK